MQAARPAPAGGGDGALLFKVAGGGPLQSKALRALTPIKSRQGGCLLEKAPVGLDFDSKSRLRPHPVL